MNSTRQCQAPVIREVRTTRTTHQGTERRSVVASSSIGRSNISGRRSSYTEGIACTTSIKATATAITRVLASGLPMCDLALLPTNSSKPCNHSLDKRQGFHTRSSSLSQLAAQSCACFAPLPDYANYQQRKIQRAMSRSNVTILTEPISPRGIEARQTRTVSIADFATAPPATRSQPPASPSTPKQERIKDIPNDPLISTPFSTVEVPISPRQLTSKLIPAMQHQRSEHSQLWMAHSENQCRNNQHEFKPIEKQQLKHRQLPCEFVQGQNLLPSQNNEVDYGNPHHQITRTNQYHHRNEYEYQNQARYRQRQQHHRERTQHHYWRQQQDQNQRDKLQLRQKHLYPQLNQSNLCHLDPSHHDDNVNTQSSVKQTSQVTVEISPGVDCTLRNVKETMDAIRQENILLVTCLGCSQDLVCISNAQYVICPQCRVVSPLLLLDDNEASSTATKNRWGLGLGVTLDTLATIQKEMSMENVGQPSTT